MTFLAPFFLLATLAAGIPVVLHMIHRQKAKDLPFSTLRFLRISVEKTRRRRRVQDMFLMAVRAVALLLVALGLARPTVTSLRSLWGGGSRSAVAIVLDNSASMAVLDGGRPRFDTARAAADQILQQSRDGDPVALFLTGGPPFPEQGVLDPGHDAVLRMLNQAAVSHERADLAVRLQQARQALAQSDAPNQAIYLITDLQKHSWDGLGADAAAAEPEVELTPADQRARRAPVVIVDCAHDAKPNAAVQAVRVDAAVPLAGVPMRATAEVFNAASVAQQRLVELYLDDAKQATSPVLSIPADGRATHTFQFTLNRGGMHRGEVRLVGEDGCALDDRRFFTVEVDQGVRVAIVTARRHEIPHLDDAFYLEQALAPRRSTAAPLRGTPLVAGDLLSEPLTPFAVIYCVNLPAPEPEVADRLRKYVEGGGHLVWICGDNVQPEAYNVAHRAAQDRLLPAPLLDRRVADAAQGHDSWPIGFLDKKHAALEHLTEPPSLYQSVLVYQHVRMDVPADAPGGSAWVLARLEDGEPLLVQRRIDRGSVTMLGTSAQVNWTNLPLRPIFLPLFTRLTLDLAGVEQAVRSSLAGAPIVLEFPDQSQPLTVEVVPPSGTQNRLSTRPEQGRRGQVFRYADTHDTGFYILRPLEGAKTSPVAVSVNVDPEEASPAKIDRDELRERLAPADVLFADNPEDLSATFTTLREGKSLWTAFLAAVLVVLVFETYVSNRLSPKQDDLAVRRGSPRTRLGSASRNAGLSPASAVER